MKKILRLFPADSNFPKLFEKEKVRLEKIIGSENSIEHVGSTAVPGLGGKGIIDIAIGVPNFADISAVAGKLMQHGYFPDLDHEPSADWEWFFLASREHNSTLGDYHLHITVKNGNEWKRLLLFRDSLRNNPNLRNKYMKLKKELLIATGADREKYKKSKNDFIESVLKGEK